MSKTVLALTAALFLTAAAAPATAGEPMTFRLLPLEDSSRCASQCAQAIVADGEITNSTPQEFLSFVSHNVQGNVRSVVFLNSAGGRVVASMELGQLFRKLGVAAIVARAGQTYGGTALAAGHCYSACVYALMGGRKRIIPPQSQVGVHRMFLYEAGLDPAAGVAVIYRKHDNGRVRSMLSRYSSRMGVNSAVIDSAERTSSDSLHVLSNKEITRWRLGQPKL
jgi:hypothetical protein